MTCRIPRLSRRFFGAFAATLMAAAPLLAQDGATWMTRAVERLCGLPGLQGYEAQLAMPDAWLTEERHWPDDENPARSLLRFDLPDGAALTVERRAPGGQLRQFRTIYLARGGDTVEPLLQAIADGGCVLRAGRKLRAGPEPWRYLDQLEGDLTTLRWTETLQAPWPPGTDPGGPRVGLVDSGLAYDLPFFRDRLARDADGRPLGFDFWDLDPWPYDGDISRGAFFPIRHGTTVASILAREAPDAGLVPYRYPRPDLGRMADLVAHAADAGVRVLAMPLGSRRAEDWTAFAEALQRHDMLAIVSAGNDGQDIDTRPIYPAALALENMIVVTSSDAFGRLAPGSNWGADYVDLMVPAENLPVTDFRGASGTASGSSYAVPRVAAMAARLLAQEPDLSIDALKARIFARAAPSPFARDQELAVGWIADPLAD